MRSYVPHGTKGTVSWWGGEFEPEVSSFSSGIHVVVPGVEKKHLHTWRVVMDAYMSGNQSGAEKDNRLLFGEQWMLLLSKSKMAATNFSQSGAELRIQDGVAHESQPCWKTAHQPRRRTGIGLTDFHGDTNHARVTQKISCNFKIDTYSVLWS